MYRELEKYLTETVFLRCAREGQFGPGMKFVRYENDTNRNNGLHYASSVIFIKAVFRESNSSAENKREKKIGLVIKCLPQNLYLREKMNCMVKFHNESVMYNEILPFLEYSGIISCIYPKFYFAESSISEDKEPTVVVEDLREKLFKISKFKVFLDYNHVVLALKTLGKFHALSYIAKQKQPDKFYKIVAKLKEHAWDQGEAGVGGIIGPCSLRGVNALYNVEKSDILKKLIDYLKSNSLKLMKYLVEPEEPMAVICHGDFCNHNILFKYSNNITSDIPTDIKFYDLQTSRYASPVIDLSMILFLNTDYELRSRHWDEFIKVYLDSLTETVKTANCIPPTYEQLINEFKNKSFYGYFHCSYFLPIILDDSLTQKLEDDLQKSQEEVIETFCRNGGEKGTQILVSIVKHLYELNYFGFLDKNVF